MTLGRVDPGRAHQVSRWYGRSQHEIAGPAPAILGDTRSALLTSVPSEIRVPVETGADALRFRSAILVRPDPGGRPRSDRTRIRAEVRFLGPDGPQVLAREEIPADDHRWRPIEAELPAGRPGELLLRLTVGGARAAGELAAAWAEPLLVRSRQSRPPAAHPDVLLVVADTFRADALADAPGLSALLRRGALWPRAVAPSNWTLPSFASILTARDPAEHGAGRAPTPEGRPGGRDYRAVRPGLPTLAEAFADAGYATALVHANPFLEPWTGLDRGFGRYVRVRDDTAAALDAAGAWWRRNADRPRFLLLQLMAPHLPYDPPGREDLPPDPLAERDAAAFLAGDPLPEERARFFALQEAERTAVIRRYRAEVEEMDRLLAPWLERLLSTDRQPLFAFAGDHGEELWDEGSFEHGHTFADAVARVPLAVVAPGIPTAVHDEAPGVHWLGPTLLRLAGIEPPPGWEHDLRRPSGSTTCTCALYRGAGAGRRFDVLSGESTPLPPEEAVAGTGPAGRLPEEVDRALRELGY